jgi:hypothetical protein
MWLIHLSRKEKNPSMPFRSLLTISVVLLLFSSTSHALTPEAKSRIHFQRGMSAFELGKFKKALSEYYEAYALTPLPGFLFNIGQCHRNLGNYHKAIFTFRLFLKKVPETDKRDAVEALIRELEAKLQAEQAQPTKVPVYVPEEKIASLPAPPPPPPPAPDPWYKSIHTKWWFWTGLAVVATGVTLGAYYGSRSSLPDSDFPVVDVSRN